MCARAQVLLLATLPLLLLALPGYREGDGDRLFLRLAFLLQLLDVLADVLLPLRQRHHFLLRQERV